MNCLSCGQVPISEGGIGCTCGSKPVANVAMNEERLRRLEGIGQSWADGPFASTYVQELCAEVRRLRSEIASRAAQAEMDAAHLDILTKEMRSVKEILGAPPNVSASDAARRVAEYPYRQTLEETRSILGARQEESTEDAARRVVALLEAG